MTTKTLARLPIGALLLAVASVHAAESNIQVAMEDGKTRAQFTVVDSRCVLIDDQIRCTRVAK